MVEAALRTAGWALPRRALEIATACDCADGCPCCTQSTRCKEHNQVLCKKAGLLLLRGICAAVDEGDDGAITELNVVVGEAGFLNEQSWMELREAAKAVA